MTGLWPEEWPSMIDDVFSDRPSEELRITVVFVGADGRETGQLMQRPKAGVEPKDRPIPKLK